MSVDPPNSCAFDGLNNNIYAFVFDPESAITDLAQKQVPPDSFHIQDGSLRFSSFAGSCQQEQINQFSELQDILGAGLRNMSTDAIADVIESLYNKAYHYDSSAGTMTLATDSESQEAKKKLDLWIAALDYQAFKDEAFLKRLWYDDEATFCVIKDPTEPRARIRRVMALNSPHLSPRDRGGLYRLEQVRGQGIEAMRKVSLQDNRSWYPRFFAWQNKFDGKSREIPKTPFWRSVIDHYDAVLASFGQDTIGELQKGTYPDDVIEKLLRKYNLVEPFRKLSALSEKDLVKRYMETQATLTAGPRPAVTRAIVTDMLLLFVELHRRGIDAESQAKEWKIKENMGFGFTREDAELMIEQGSVRFTHSRADDNRARHALLGRYKTVYQKLMKTPLEDRFTPESIGQAAIWGRFILNRSLTGVPIRLSDLDQIRADVRQSLSTDSKPVTAADFFSRDPQKPYWHSPEDLGVGAGSWSGPLSMANYIFVDETNVGELIQNNVEFYAFLPDHLYPHDHSLGLSLSAYGIALVRNTNSLTGDIFGPGLTLAVAVHEAAHGDDFRTNLEQDPKQLLWNTPDERRARLFGLGALKQYRTLGLEEPFEIKANSMEIDYHYKIIREANIWLGLDPENFDTDAWSDDWIGADASFFALRPDQLYAAANYDPGKRDSQKKLARVWSRLLDLAMKDVISDPNEKKKVEQTLLALESPDNDKSSSLYFVASDPIMRVLNRVIEVVNGRPGKFLIATRDEWQDIKNNLAQSALQRIAAYKRQQSRANPTSP